MLLPIWRHRSIEVTRLPPVSLIYVHVRTCLHVTNPLKFQRVIKSLMSLSMKWEFMIRIFINKVLTTSSQTTYASERAAIELVVPLVLEANNDRLQELSNFLQPLGLLKYSCLFCLLQGRNTLIKMHFARQKTGRRVEKQGLTHRDEI